MARRDNRILGETKRRMVAMAESPPGTLSPLSQISKIAHLVHSAITDGPMEPYLMQEIYAIYHVRLGAILETTARLCLVKVLNSNPEVARKLLDSDVVRKSEDAIRLDLSTFQRMLDENVRPVELAVQSLRFGSLEQWSANWQIVVERGAFLDTIEAQWGAFCARQKVGFVSLAETIPNWRRIFAAFYGARHQAAHDALLDLDCTASDMAEREIVVVLYVQSLMQLTAKLVSGTPLLTPRPSDLRPSGQVNFRFGDDGIWGTHFVGEDGAPVELPAYMSIDDLLSDKWEVASDPGNCECGKE